MDSEEYDYDSVEYYNGKNLILDYTKITNIEVDGIDHKDHPQYCDGYISYAEYDGREMTEEELTNLDSDFVYEQVYKAAVGAWH